MGVTHLLLLGHTILIVYLMNLVDLVFED